jgi:hypothetical protein
MHSAMNIANCTKETESERESFPQTPFIEKGKGKENLTSSRCDEGDDDDVCDNPHNTLSPSSSKKRSPALTQNRE